MDAHRVVGVGHRAQVGDEQPDFGAAVEPLVARERPRDAAQVERAQELVGVVVGAHQDGHVVGPPAPVVQPILDELGHLVGLLGGRLVVQVLRREAGRLAHRGEVLLDAVLHFQPLRIVVDDEPVGGVEDGLVRAVVGGEDDAARLRIAREEPAHVGDGGPAPAIDGLVVVGHHCDVVVPGGEELHHLELGVVGVLELVHKDVAEAALVAAEHVGARAQEAQGVGDLVAEVDHAFLAHQLLVARVGLRQLAMLLGALAQLLVLGQRGRRLGQPLRVRHVLRRRDVLVLAAAEERDHRLDVPRGVAEGAVVREGKLEQPVAEEDDLLGAVQHAEVGRQADLERVLAHQPVAEGVESRNFHVGVAVGHQGVDALLHLRGGLLGEGQGQDLFGTRLALGDEVGDAPGDDGGLAGAGAGDDQEGIGLVGDGGALLVVQAVEDAPAYHLRSTIPKAPPRTALKASDCARRRPQRARRPAIRSAADAHPASKGCPGSSRSMTSGVWSDGSGLPFRASRSISAHTVRSASGRVTSR